MSKNELEKQVNRCLQVIEEQLKWGISTDWTNYDFSKLSDEIHNRTQVRLSVTTLKRIWGRLKYESAPTLTTLNALAAFAGYVDWRDFCQKEGIGEVVIELESRGNSSVAKKSFNKIWFLSAIPFLAIAYFLMLSSNKPKKLNPDDFAFRPDKIKTDGVPNSVVFHYDASAAPNDSVYIVQTWDIRRKKLVSRNNHEHSAIYYYPGFFNTKLIVDNQIVKAQNLWITSDGWLCLKEADPVPLYFKKEEYTKGDRIEVDEDLLSKYNVSLHPTPPMLRFFNQRDLGDLMNDNFIFETNVRTQFEEGVGACQFVQLLIQCKNDIIGIPLSAKACIGDIDLFFCGELVEGANSDLSGFGADLNEWTKVHVESVNKLVTIFVNDKKAYSLTFPNEPTGIVGVQYRFNGVGAVKDTWFENSSGRIQF